MCKTPHKHAELIKAWADGNTIQFYNTLTQDWRDCVDNPQWYLSGNYRIKPEPTDLERYGVEVGDVWDTEGGYVQTISCANVVGGMYHTTKGVTCSKHRLKTLLFRRGVVNKL